MGPRGLKIHIPNTPTSSKYDDNHRNDSAVELAAFILGSQKIAYGGFRRSEESTAGLQVIFETGISLVVPSEALTEYIAFPGTFSEFKATQRGYFHVISILSTLARVVEI